jgi:hypothetical protein
MPYTNDPRIFEGIDEYANVIKYHGLQTGLIKAFFLDHFNFFVIILMKISKKKSR